VNIYVQVLLNHYRLETAQVNLDNYQEIFKKVSLLYENGQTTLSEIEKVNSSLALAQSYYFDKQLCFTVS